MKEELEIKTENAYERKVLIDENGTAEGLNIILNPLTTSNFTKVFMNEAANHFAIISAKEGNLLSELSFQSAPVNEVGVNGAFNEDFLLIVLTRLENFQKGEFACKENEQAIIKIQEALMWLSKRTKDREMRNVLGTYNK